MEAFVKTVERDYVYLADLPAAAVLALLPSWFDDDNETDASMAVVNPDVAERTS